MDCDQSTTIPDWIIEHPETTGVFSELGLDVSCGGKSLEYVCFQNGLDVEAVLQRLREVIEDRR
ncbi:hypothetical protein Q31b_10060 [Novipirellula aureliae]|uniref:Iron-sulfur cluster repair di-iron protein n=1 Tax=Novipirellula aureliae TaxID=2527966 RepID=A0A5C6EAR1_9BACT|nr:DUF542 domain-containing protein [Novipirellula aureliae]TWU45830.1 hypothetical protein Q31b_10060 [Novipirellula aureliae]